MTRAVTTRRQRFLPYRYDEHGLDMRFVRCQLDGSREAPAFDVEHRTLDLSGQRFTVAELRFSVTFTAALLDSAFPPEERKRPSGRIVVRAVCATTRVRRSVVLVDGPLVAGTLEGAMPFQQRDVFGTIELVPMLVRAADRVDAGDTYASAAWSRLATGRGIEIRTDAARAMRGEYLDIRYESFREGGVLKYPQTTALYQLDCDGDAPVLWLNTDHQRVYAVLEAAGTIGRAARMRDLLFSQISAPVWSRLFWRAAHDVGETGETLHEWQEAVLSRYLPRLYPDAPDHESRLEVLRDELEQGLADTITARLDLVLQDELALGSKAESLAQELG